MAMTARVTANRARAVAKGSGTKQSPWELTTPSGSSEYQMYKDDSASPPALVCIVGKTELRYQARAIEDVHKMLKANGGWVPLGSADESGCTCRRCSRPSAWPSSNTTRRTTG